MPLKDPSDLVENMSAEMGAQASISKVGGSHHDMKEGAFQADLLLHRDLVVPDT